MLRLHSFLTILVIVQQKNHLLGSFRILKDYFYKTELLIETNLSGRQED